MVKNRKLLAEQLVEESVVLLKNENQLLPLQEGQTVAVFGRSALVTYVSGNGSGAARGAESSNIIIELEKAGISVCEELKQYYLQQREAEAANPQEEFDFSQMKEAVNSGLMYEIFGTYHAPVPEYPIPECLLTNVRDKTNTAILVLGRNAGGEECDRRLEGDYYLTEEEKKMVKGLVINKFRGDKTILDPGVAMLEEKCGIPVVGVAPYMNIQVEDEDSLTERFERPQEVGQIDMAVIRIPRISNFTDFNPLESIPGVSLRYVQHPSDLMHPDVIFLPGTKNTMEDLKWLRESGMETLILKAAASGTLIFGICGGYQMLGETLSDPYGVEAGGSMRGMGLLPMDTVFAEKKTRTQVNGRFLEMDQEFETLSNVEFTGYEIHMGESRRKDGATASTFTCDSVTGTEKTEGTFRKNVCGTYVHGIFDKEDVAMGLVRAVGEKKGIDVSDMAGVDFAAFKETQYDILASELRKHLDMKRIYEILEEGIETEGEAQE